MCVWGGGWRNVIRSTCVVCVFSDIPIFVSNFPGQLLLISLFIQGEGVVCGTVKTDSYVVGRFTREAFESGALGQAREFSERSGGNI